MLEGDGEIIFSFRFGYYGDFVFDRYLENNLKIKTDRTRMITNAGYLVFGMKGAEIFATIGESRLSIFSPAISFSQGQSFPEDSAIVDIAFHDNLSWSVGGRYQFFHYRCLGLGVAGQYFQTKPHLDYFNVLDNFQITNNICTNWKEWQVGLGCSLDFASPFPVFAWSLYSAVKYSHCAVRGNMPLMLASSISLLDADLFLPNFHSRKNIGLAIGATAVMNTKVGVTVEASFFDTSAVTAVLEINF